jgi:hypothetical protein
MRKFVLVGAFALLAAGAAGVASAGSGGGGVTGPVGGSGSRIERGFEIAPVELDLEGKNLALVGLGSYIVNAQSGCNDCHSCPSYAPGHSPYAGGDGKINATNYLAGGVPFGPAVVSRNITPDSCGKPAGLTFEEFEHVMLTGQDPDNPTEVLQVMPWPIFGHMTRHDLRAIYEYLRSIPHAEPGACSFGGE